ncbi:single-stranded-DNA-specific exonuclease [uncultured Gammaproteobacteria bacterium]
MLPPTDPPFLNVTRSLTGRRWLGRLADDRLTAALTQSRGLPEVVGRVLAARGVGLDTVDSFLTPTLRDLLPDPNHLLDMEVFADRLARAVTTGEQVVIFGDYDVDGATSGALLVRFLRLVGATEPWIYVPDRVAEGYGPNAPALLRLQSQGAGLVVTVDCGTSAFEALEAAAAAGLDVVVLDHHTAEPRLPPARAIVNPNRLDEDSPHRTLCAAGVTFLAAIAVNRKLRSQGWFRQRPEPDLMALLDLVALGTVCDVMPLTGLNRALVTQGLKVMARRNNTGLTALADLAGIKEKPTAYHAGFVLGPRINAGGRIGRPDLGTRLLSSDDATEAAEIAQQLDAHNVERKGVESGVLEAALALVEPGQAGGLLFVVGEGWHPGVIGIVAARLMERYHRPTCVVSRNGGVGKGSGRSVPGIDLGAAVIAARQAGLLLAGGGHRMAAGFTVALDRIEALHQFLDERISAQLAEGPGAIEPTLMLDGALSVGAATTELVGTLARLAPFGAGNAEPRFAITDARLVRADVVGTAHVRCILSGAGGGRLKAIAFRAVETDLGRALLTTGGRPLHLAGPLRIDRWNGVESVQLLIDDAAIP